MIMPFYGLLLLLAMGMQGGWCCDDHPHPPKGNQHSYSWLSPHGDTMPLILIEPTITQEPAMRTRHKCPEGYQLVRPAQVFAWDDAVYRQPKQVTIGDRVYEYADDPPDPPSDDGYRCVAAEKGKP